MLFSGGKLFRLNSRQLTVLLSIGLVIKTHTAFPQEENFVGYRHEYYREDDHRMSIDTDTASFDVGLGDHVRVSALMVQDAISGATPTGAPPQTQWPFPTFKTFYSQDYSGLLHAAINNPNNLILYQSGYFPTFQAYTNYVATNNTQLRGQATNLANASYNALAKNRNFHNTRVPVTYLHDLRNAFSISTPVTVGPAKFSQQFTPQVSYSKESDYRSEGLSLNYAAMINQKNTTINAGWSHNSDLVRDDTLSHWRPKISDEVLIGLNQLLTPKSYLTVDFTLGREHGYLSDPYRGVMAMDNFLQSNPSDASLTPEQRPRQKNQEIIYLGYTRFIDKVNGSLDVGYRGYHDSYGIWGHTVETAWHQKLWRNLYLSPSFRYYNQTAATFYYVLVPDFNNLPPFYSSDYRLSEMQTFDFSVTLSYRVLKWVSIDLSYSRYIMEGLDGVTSQSAYPSANVYSVGGRIWF
jgi:hypothetical protein